MVGVIKLNDKAYRVKTTMKEFKQQDRPTVPYTYENRAN